MLQVVKFSDFRDYEKFNRIFIESNPMLYYYLENTIKRVLDGKGKDPRLYNCFNITDVNSHIAVLLIENECLIYADNINAEVTAKLSEELPFSLFKRYMFFGTKQIIDALFQSHNVEYEEQKHRIIYECKTVSENFLCSPGTIAMAEEGKILELAQFNVKFEKEYHDREKEFEKAVEFVVGAINADNLYQWNVEDQICAMAQVIYGDYGFPVIGHVFTNPRFRGKGYAASLVHRLTQGLLEAGYEKCMLSTNAYTPASNKAFLRAGYVKTGDYVVRFKTK